jgi:hypothetical protein
MQERFRDIFTHLNIPSASVLFGIIEANQTGFHVMQIPNICNDICFIIVCISLYFIYLGSGLSPQDVLVRHLNI